MKGILPLSKLWSYSVLKMLDESWKLRTNLCAYITICVHHLLSQSRLTVYYSISSFCDFSVVQLSDIGVTGQVDSEITFFILDLCRRIILNRESAICDGYKTWTLFVRGLQDRWRSY